MKTYHLDIEIDQFWYNFWELKNSSNIPLPMDSVKLKCECEQDIVVFPNGEHFCEATLQSAEELVIQEIEKAKKNHQDQHNCQSSVVDMEAPENIILMVKNLDPNGVKAFNLMGADFIPKVLVVRNKTPAMIIYRNKASLYRTYSSYVGQNFKTILNVLDQEAVIEEDIEDDETASAKQHERPRIVGGGRRMLQDYKYICQWCSPETLAKPTRGRFREIKNYRDHFKKYHVPEYPFSVFLNSVEKDEPKFHCKICKQKFCLSNQLRHQVICRPPAYEQDDSDDSDGIDNVVNPDPAVGNVSNNELPAQNNTNEDYRENVDNDSNNELQTLNQKNTNEDDIDKDNTDIDDNESINDLPTVNQKKTNGDDTEKDNTSKNI